MARIPADRDIRRLIGSVLINADAQLVNPNGIELRLGKHVLFHSTGEEKELEPGLFLTPFLRIGLSPVVLVGRKSSIEAG